MIIVNFVRFSCMFIVIKIYNVSIHLHSPRIYFSRTTFFLYFHLTLIHYPINSGFAYLPFQPFMYSSIHSTYHPLTRPITHQPFQPSMYLSIHPSICSIHPLTCKPYINYFIPSARQQWRRKRNNHLLVYILYFEYFLAIHILKCLN